VGGFTMGDPVHKTAAETWHGMLDLNAGTLLNAVRAVVPAMIAQKSGRIITIGARPSWEGKPNMGAYSAAKAAVLRLTESMAAELKSKGITANCLIPGTIDTPENRQAMPDADTANWVQPSSLAEVILFLASDQAGDIRGAAVPVYGGVKS
jgi:NAD(P)-dependent dehydrogenase (short-subunit alcohol dehydrogenase family)